MAKKAEEKIEHNKFERARIIGSRALQISMGAPFLVKISKQDIEKLKFNPIEIAKKEYAAGVIPIRIVRPMPGKRFKKKEEK